MKRKKSTNGADSVPIEHVCDLAACHCHCDDFAPAIEELTRQIHFLGVIIDELVSEFQWHNNQIAEQIRGASDYAESLMPESTKPSLQPVRAHRTTLFE